MTSVSIPAVDLGHFRDGSPAERADLLRTVNDACRRLGLFTAGWAGLDLSPVTAVLDATQEFFDRPLPDKLRHHSELTSRGYTPLGAESLGSTLAGATGSAAAPDQKEAFAADRADILGSADRPAGSGPPVLWPDRPPRLRTAWAAAFGCLHAVASTVLEVFSEVLGTADGELTSAFTDGADFLRVIHYPARPAGVRPAGVRAGAHTDFGALAVIFAAGDRRGFQVQDAAGRWLDVPIAAGRFVVNTGDFVPLWTAGRWRAALHRVGDPDNRLAAAGRRSVVFFHNPRPDTVMRPLLSCGGPAEAEPPTAGELLASKTARQRLVV